MTTPATNKQVPDQSIMDKFNKQIYLGNSFVVSESLSLGTTAEFNLFLIRNPNVSSFQLSKSLFIQLSRFASSAQSALIQTYISPVVSTVGTPLVPVNLRPANPNTSVAQVYSNGQFTLSSRGTLMFSLGVGGTNASSLDGLMTIIDQGFDLLITGEAVTASTLLSSTLSWYEI